MTSVDNLSSIRATGCLESAASMLERDGQAELTRKRRPWRAKVFLNGAGVWLQSQAPLYVRNILFCQGWGLEDLLGRLNSLVFFWPGTEDGPNIYGKRHLESASWDGSVAILRTSTAALFGANGSLCPLLCRFNSGSPRYSKGQASPRGPNTFVPIEEFEGTSSDVAELTFPGRVVLPNDTEVRVTANGNWELFLL